jgi:predicted permease
VRSGLVALQATLSVLLLVGAGLFLRSLNEAGRLALGYDPERVAAFRWHTAGLDWEPARMSALHDAALARVQALPQVEAAALSMTTPLAGQRLYGRIRVPGLDSIDTTRDIIYSPVTVDYFRTVGAHVVHGRAFAPRDVQGSPEVAIVTESLARLLWPGEVATGRCFMTTPEPDAACHEVVGVIEDTRYGSVLDEPALMFYLPRAPGAGRMSGLLVRLRGDADAGIASLHAALQSLEPGLPHLQAELLEERVAPELLPWRLGAVMFSAFGALALLLASLGLYGVVAYEVAQRRREMGVRVALGARVANVLRLVLGDALRVVAIGLVIGLAGAVYAARWIEPLLYGVSARDPAVHSGVAVLLLAVALLAAALPAWRAAHVQPTEALRDD